MQFSDDSQTFVITTQKGFKKITSQTKTSGIIYKTAYKTAQDALSALQIACDYASRNTTIEDKPISEADEILKFKKLLDDGIISQEEFETKKKQLLGM